MAVQIMLEGQPAKYLTAPNYTLGRASDCDVLLPESDALVSRHHARMERDASGQWWIVDTSTNGTFVNGERLSGRRALRNGDQLGVGRTQIGFVSSQAVVASDAPVRATETIFVTQQQVQAKIADPPLQPIPPVQAVTPPVPSVFVTPGAPSISSSNAMIPPSASLPVEIAPMPQIAEGEEVNAHRAPFFEPEGVQYPEASPAVVAEEKSIESLPPDTPPILIAPPASEASMPALVESLSVEESQMKQCTRCRNVYSQTEEDCPSCGHAGFKIKSVVAPTSMAFPVVTGKESTPFDQAIEKSASSSITPAPVTSSPEVVSPSPPPARLQPASPAKGTQGIIAAGCGAAMLFSLFLPWAQIQMFFVSGSVSYAQLCQLAMEGASQSNNLAIKAIGQEPRILLFFLPMLATLFALGGAVTAFLGAAGNLPSAAQRVSTGMVLGIGGALGAVAVILLFLNLDGGKADMEMVSVLGPGFWLFALTSLVATITGFGSGALGAASASSKPSGRG